MSTGFTGCSWESRFAGCAIAALAFAALPSDSVAAADGPIIFTKHVAPILQEKCVSCHRPNEMAPMPLRTYQEARPWARSIRNKVSKREMPPWFINRSVGIQHYKGDPTLTEAQIETIVKWVDGGALEGNPADMPAPRAFADEGAGWTIGKPDLIVRLSKPFSMYARGSDWWMNEQVPTGLTEDRWVKAVQLRPGNRKIVHHFCSGPLPPAAAGGTSDDGGVGVVGPQDRYAQEERAEQERERKLAGEGGGGARASTSAGIGGGSFGCFLPGKGGVVFPEGSGVLLKAGGRVSFGMHYSAWGEEGTDQSEIGLVLYPQGVTPTHSINTAFFQKFPAFELDIPANSRVTSDAYMRLPNPVRLNSFTPHMHMRGNALTLEAILPNGRVITIAGVENYNFNWQIEYFFEDDLAPLLPANTMLHAIVVHDNTVANRYNPNPNKWVGYGQASVEEMAGTFVRWTQLTEEEYLKATSERRAKQRAAQTQDQQQ